MAKGNKAERKQLGLFRLEVELAVLGHGGDVAEAIHARTGIDSREGLATADPRAVSRAMRSSNTEPDAAWRVNAEALELLQAGSGKDLSVFRRPTPERVTTKAKKVASRIARLNPTAEVIPIEQLQRASVKEEAVMRARRLLREAGVADLASLGKFPVRGKRRVEPGFHLALPVAGDPSGARARAADDLADQLMRHGRQHFERVERREDALRFHERGPVHRAVILAPTLEFLADGELVIAKEISQLTIIADEIVYGDVLSITHEDQDEAPDQPTALQPAQDGDPNTKRHIFMKEPRSGGPPYQGRHGEDGAHGADGTKQTDGDELRLAPDLSIYVKSTPGGLPDIDLKGRSGGEGQPGQAGGRGGDGARGGSSKSGPFQCKYPAGNGGNGGDGGNGGRGADGGKGGTGGSVEIITLEDNIELAHSARRPEIHIDGGFGGGGGVGGNGGSAGSSGMAGEVKGLWCSKGSEHAGLYGDNGEPGDRGEPGERGDGGTFSLITVTEDEWNAAVNRPWIVRFIPWNTHVGEQVTVVGMHLSEGVEVRFEGRSLTPDWVDLEAERLAFTVPASAKGGQNTVRLRATDDLGGTVLSDPLELRVLPNLLSLTPAAGVPNKLLTLEGTGFDPDCEIEIGGVRFHPDASAENTSKRLELTLPDHEHIGLEAGLHEVQVVNPDKGRSPASSFDLSLDVTVPVKAWRVQPDMWLSGGGGFGGDECPYPGRSADKIRKLFQCGVLEEIWGPHRITFDFDPQVDDIVVPADVGVNWPREQGRRENNAILKATDAAGNYLHYHPGAVNFYFVANIDEVDGNGTTFGFVDKIGDLDKMSPGSTVIFADSILGTRDEARVAAHEFGHILSLDHVCGDSPGTRFGRECYASDKKYLMFSGGIKLTRKTEILEDEARDARILACVLHPTEED